MSKARLVITAVVFEGRSQADVARAYGVSKGWVSKLVARYRAEGEAAFEARSRRPHTSPTAISEETVALILRLRAELTDRGMDAGAHTIAWHLQQQAVTVAPATIWRTLRRHDAIIPDPDKRPRSSYRSFQADLPNECWQSDLTHWRLADRSDVEILTFLDDCTRYAISVTAHRAVTSPIVVTAFRDAITTYGPPASTLTDNGMVYTVKHAGHGRRGGRNAFENDLADRGITQKNGSPFHPQTQGKVERFQQTLKNWLHHQTPAATIHDLQQQLDRFATEYNHTTGPTEHCPTTPHLPAATRHSPKPPRHPAPTPTATPASDTTASTRPAASASASPDASTTSASAEPTPELTSSYLSTTSTSSTPQPANSSAASPSTTNPKTPRNPEPIGPGVSDVLRQDKRGDGGI